MAIKYYAVKAGRRPGIYTNWDECQEQVKGFKGARFKSFATEVEALDFIAGLDEAEKEISPQCNDSPSDDMDGRTVIYTDGSYDKDRATYSFGAVILTGEMRANGTSPIMLYGSDNKIPWASSMNVAGEILGAMRALEFADANGLDNVVLYHDYEGIGKWARGEWNAKTAPSIEYRKFLSRLGAKVEFRHVKGHSGNKFNELADTLARKALGKA